MALKWYSLLPGGTLLYGGNVIVILFVAAVVVRVICGFVYTSRGLLKIAEIQLLLSWGIMTMAYTIWNREPSSEASIELELFWCIRKAWTEYNPISWYLIVGNIFLFMPLGIILALLLENKFNFFKVVLIGFFVSLCIELLQLYYHVGLFELDDLFNNTLGCYLGECVFVAVKYLREKGGQKRSISDSMFCVALVSLLMMILFFGMAIAMGQPVFGNFISV